MNISQYNQALNQAMPWTAKLADIDPKKLETTQEDLQEELQCKADFKRDELREDGICTDTEYDYVKTDDKGSAIL